MPTSTSRPQAAANSPVENPESDESDGHSSESDKENEESQFSTRAVAKRLGKSKRALGFSHKPYRQAAAYLQRTHHVDICWGSVLTRGLGNDFQVYGTLTKEQFQARFKNQINDYNTIMNRVPSLASDRELMKKDPDVIDRLSKKMTNAANQARSNDIHYLKDKFLQYLAKELPEGVVIPRQPDKSDRGWRNQYTAQLLVPAILRSKFDEDPETMMAELSNGSALIHDDREIYVDENNFPSFMWPEGGFIPGAENHDINFLRSPLLIRVCRHVITTPTSALKSIDDEITAMVKGLAKKEKMDSVTPGLIAYVCILLRHSASTSREWAEQDRNFHYTKFFSRIMDLFDKTDEDADIEWIDSTLAWWNQKVLGSGGHSSSGNDGPESSSKKRVAESTYGDIKKARAAKRRRREAENAGRATELPLSSSRLPGSPPGQPLSSSSSVNASHSPSSATTSNASNNPNNHMHPNPPMNPYMSNGNNQNFPSNHDVSNAPRRARQSTDAEDPSSPSMHRNFPSYAQHQPSHSAVPGSYHPQSHLQAQANAAHNGSFPGHQQTEYISGLHPGNLHPQQGHPQNNPQAMHHYQMMPGSADRGPGGQYPPASFNPS